MPVFRTLFPLLLLLTSATVMVPSHAETLRIPATSLTAEGLPERGMTMVAVEAEYGPPETRFDQVGGGHAKRPPIVRWDYSDFYVVFEKDRAIIAAPKNRAVKPIRQSEQLEVESEPVTGTP
ncbi:hypothetical protein [Algiphilus sp.]|uniref:hypothetical protein n=1 Tax=Algiphilus sp. TaxID=1872431 RepID=UPI003B51DEFE